MALHKNIKILAWFNFFTDFRLFAPVAIIYVTQISGSFTLGMSIFSTVFISSALLEVPTGIFSDKIGRKNTLILGAVAKIIGLTFFAIGGSYTYLLVGAFFEGLGRALYSGNNDALLHSTLAETNQEHDYHIFLGKVSSLFQFASAIAAVLGGIIASFSFSLVMWLSVIPAILCLGLSFLITEPKIKLKETGNIYNHLISAFKQVVKNKKLRLLATANIINSGMGDAGYEFKAAFYNTVWPIWALGIARMVSNIAAGISYYFGGRIINRVGAVKVLLIESVATPLMNTFAVLILTPLSPVIMALTSLFYGAGSVASNSLQQKEFTNEQRATMGSLISLGSSLFNAFSAFLLGVIADHFGIVAAILFAQVTLSSLIFLYSKIYRNYL